MSIGGMLEVLPWLVQLVAVLGVGTGAGQAYANYFNPPCSTFDGVGDALIRGTFLGFFGGAVGDLVGPAAGKGLDSAFHRFPGTPGSRLGQFLDVNDEIIHVGGPGASRIGNIGGGVLGTTIGKLPKQPAITSQYGFRAMLIKSLMGYRYRELSVQLTQCPVYRWFCRVEMFGPIKSPGKSSLQEWAHQLPVDQLQRIIDHITATTAAPRNPLELKNQIELDTVWMDTTCLKANIHFPVDWILLRDAVRNMSKLYQRLQTRRAQTEARIAIMRNDFAGTPMRSKRLPDRLSPQLKG